MRYIWFICICLTIAIGGWFCNNPAYQHRPSWYERHLNKVSEHLLTIATHLKAYNAQNDRYPDNNEGLTVLSGLRNEIKVNQPKRGEMYDYNGIILSPWQEPFMYENRRGLPEDKFSDSPVNQDKKQNYSLKVDEGIYVYSLGSMDLYLEYNDFTKKMWRTRIISIGVLIIFIFLFIISKKPTAKTNTIKAIRTVLSSILFLASVIIGIIPLGVSCYKMTYFSPYRRPEMIAQYNVLLDKYRQRGVITDATYQKIKQGLADVDKLIKDDNIR